MAEQLGKLGKAPPALPSDSELVDHLERAVVEVFATMIGECERVERLDGALPSESASQTGRVQLALSAGATPAMTVEREAVVEFRGPLAGRVSLRAAEDCAASIARGLLMSAPDDPLSREDVDDALKECANMLTGWIKSQALDPLGAFTMSVPFIGAGRRGVVGSPSGALVYRTGGGLFAIELTRRAALAESER